MGAGDVAEELLEVDVLVPELVYARQKGDGAVEEIAGMLDVAALELHLGVREPELNAPRTDVERALENGARAGVLALTCLYNGIQT